MEKKKIIAKCCTCHRVRMEGEWVWREDESPVTHRISHGYCPGCAEKVYATIDQYPAVAV